MSKQKKITGISLAAFVDGSDGFMRNFNMLKKELAHTQTRLNELSSEQRRLGNIDDDGYALDTEEIINERDGIIRMQQMVTAFDGEVQDKVRRATNNTVKATGAANIRHSKHGGSREKQEEIRRLWATGKFTSRDICAEQECARLNMSFSAARKALRNTADPA